MCGGGRTRGKRGLDWGRTGVGLGVELGGGLRVGLGGGLRVGLGGWTKSRTGRRSD